MRSGLREGCCAGRWERFLLFLIGKPRYSSKVHGTFTLGDGDVGSFYIRLYTEDPKEADQ